MTDYERFWSKVKRNPSTLCWEWMASRHPRGYGQFGVQGRSVKAHRYAYETQVGPIPSGMVVMHTCDNPPCVNPSHLRLGTQGDNARDMLAKGRRAPTFGERNTKAKLSQSDVDQIRARHAAGEANMRQLGDEYGVSDKTVWKLIHRLSWNHPEEGTDE